MNVLQLSLRLEPFFNHELIIVEDYKAQILLETVKNSAKHTINNHNICTKDLYSGVELGA